MASDVEICNMALNLIGDEGTAVSVTPPEGTPQARMAASAYQFALQALLESFDWTFARKAVVLAPLDTEETDGWGYAYVLPADCLRVRTVRPKGRSAPYMACAYAYGSWDGDTNNIEYAVGRSGPYKALFTNVPDAVLRYTSTDVRTDMFSPQFAIALSYQIASLIVGKRVGGEEGVKLLQVIKNEAVRNTALARAVDVSQRQRLSRFIPNWIKGR